VTPTILLVFKLFACSERRFQFRCTFGYFPIEFVQFGKMQNSTISSHTDLCTFCSKSKAVPLHAMEARGGRGGIALAHSRPRY
jgi:hypothetical protein